tara:strand:+ start:860 stop:1177 length:318 start_codon:yes stop_codon:yes gene_type:complete
MCFTLIIDNLWDLLQANPVILVRSNCMTWNASISIKCNGKLNKTHWEAVKEWGWVQQLWSTSGDWDFQLICNDKISDQNALQSAVFDLRKQEWIEDSKTQWWKAL